MAIGFVYILSNKSDSVLYVGFTDDLIGRTTQHKENYYPKSFSARYNTDKLVYYEELENLDAAYARERQLKGYSRDRKINLVQAINPTFRDLFEEVKKRYGEGSD